MFKGPGGFNRLINIEMCIVMCVVLSIVIPLAVEAGLGITGVLTPIGFLQGFVLSYFVSYLWGDLLPAPMWGGKLAGALHARGFLGYLIQVIVTALVFITVISFSMAFVNNIVDGGMAGVINFWLMIYPQAFLWGFIAIFIFMKLCQKIAISLSGFDPAAAHQGDPAVAQERIEADSMAK